MSQKPLTPKQQRFVEEYLTDLNATQAALRAGYSPRAAKQLGSRNLASPDVAAAIGGKREKLARKAEVTVESLAEELELARSLGMTEKQVSAAVSATMGKAKLFGLGVENRKLSGTLQVVTITAKQLDGLTDDEIHRLDAAYPVLEKLGIVGGARAAEAAAAGAEAAGTYEASLHGGEG